MGKKGKFYGGRVLGNLSTYYCLYLPDYYSANKQGYVAEHRYFYEQYHKCCVLPGVDIYHIDRNKQNNMIWNLGILRNTDLASLLFKKDMTGRRCTICGSTRTGTISIKGRIYSQWFGSVEMETLKCKACWLRDYKRRKKKKPLI